MSSFYINYVSNLDFIKVKIIYFSFDMKIYFFIYFTYKNLFYNNVNHIFFKNPFLKNYN